MLNGTTGHIADIRSHCDESPDAEIDIATLAGIITCSRETFDRSDGGIDLAYAVTSYAVQGSTNDVSTSAIGPSTNRSELYVDITRGRFQNQLFGTRPVTDVNEAGAGLPRLASELVPVLQTRLSRSDARTALALDPAARHSANYAQGRTLAGLHAARHRGEGDPYLDAAIGRAEAAVRRIAEHEPPTNIDRVLPPCPRSPHLAARWRATVADVAVYLATVQPRTRPDQGGLPGVIGSRAEVSDPSRWDEIAQSLRSTAADIVLRELVDHLRRYDEHDVALVVQRRPDWLVHHIESRVEAGTLPGLDLGRFGAVVRDVERWRVEHDLVDRTDADGPLGPVPDDARLRAERTQLQRRLVTRARPESGRSIA